MWELYENNHPLDMVDQRLEDFDSEEALRAIKVALLCTQGSPHQRPPMSRVVAMLTGDVEAPDVVTTPSYITEWQVKARSSSSYTGTSISLSAAALLRAGMPRRRPGTRRQCSPPSSMRAGEVRVRAEVFVSWHLRW